MSRRRAVLGGGGRYLVVAAMVVAGLVGSGVQVTDAAGATPAVKPSITLTASPSKVKNGDGTVTLSYSVANASSCYFSPNTKANIYQNIAVSCPGSGTQSVLLPLDKGTMPSTYTFTLNASGAKTATKTVTVSVLPGDGRPALSGVETVLGTYYGTMCALLSSGGVDCWGSNAYGSLGNGTVTAPQTCDDTPCATTPNPVVGVGGVGTLSDVVQIAADGTGTFCARLGSGGVDCWGPEYFGELGDGSGTESTTCQEASCSPTPVVVLDASGSLSGVTDLQADNEQTFCAALNSGGVDCWGSGYDSNTGNGTTNYTNPIASPVIAVGSEADPYPPGPPPLTGVASLSDGGIGFCAIMTTSGVDCWGFNRYANLGMGSVDTAPNACHGESGAGDCSAEPQVVVTSDGSSLSGVKQVTPDGVYGWCAILTSTGADCWGDNTFGEVGDGSMTGPVDDCYSDEPCSPYATPVVDPTDTTTLTGVTDLVSEWTPPGGDEYPGVCAILTSGGVDCWGSDNEGALGDQGTTGSSPTPLVVDAPDTTNPLSGVTAMAPDGYGGFCAAASGNLDCWGYYNGVSPVSTVFKVGGKKALSRVTNVASIPDPNLGYCAILRGGKVDCMDERNIYGELGNGGSGPTSVTPAAPLPTSSYNSPTEVFAPF